MRKKPLIPCEYCCSLLMDTTKRPICSKIITNTSPVRLNIIRYQPLWTFLSFFFSIFLIFSSQMYIYPLNLILSVAHFHMLHKKSFPEQESSGILVKFYIARLSFSVKKYYNTFVYDVNVRKD